MSEVDNTGQAPVIPAGTEPTVWGKAAFEGQAPDAVPTSTTPEETPQPSSPEAPQDAEQRSTFEELAAKKGFKSADDLAKSYMELEKQRTKDAMDASELLKAKEEALNATNPKPQYDEMSKDEAVKIVEDLIDRKVKPLQEKLAIQETFKNPEDMAYAPQVAEFIKKNPNTAWDVALDVVKYRNQSRESIKEEAQQEVQALQSKKQSAQVSPAPVGTKQPETLDNIVDALNNKELPFREVQKIMKERFSQ